MRALYPTDILIELDVERDMFGEVITEKRIRTMCKFVETAETKNNKDGTYTTLSGTAKIAGDIAPTVKTIKGSCVINKCDYQIHTALRKRDKRGRVYKTVLELV